MAETVKGRREGAAGVAVDGSQVASIRRKKLLMPAALDVTCRIELAENPRKSEGPFLVPQIDLVTIPLMASC